MKLPRLLESVEELHTRLHPQRVPDVNPPQEGPAVHMGQEHASRVRRNQAAAQIPNGIAAI